jgi:hypothetical protein
MFSTGYDIIWDLATQPLLEIADENVNTRLCRSHIKTTYSASKPC